MRRQPAVGSVAALLLAAGRGTRMRSVLPKPLVPLVGKPIVQHLVDTLRVVGVESITLVVGYEARQVMAALGPRLGYVHQQQQLGTAHAVKMARSALRRASAGALFVSVGDSPLLTPPTLRRLFRHHRDTGADCTFLTGVFEEPLPYARVIRDARGGVLRCVEQRDATPAEAAVRELFTSHYLFRPPVLWECLEEIAPNPLSGEQYLTDIIAIMLQRGHHLQALPVDDPRELVGLNTQQQVAWAEDVLRARGAGAR